MCRRSRTPRNLLISNTEGNVEPNPNDSAQTEVTEIDTLEKHLRKPSVLRVIWTDYVACLAMLALVIGWAIFIVLATFGILPDITGRGRDPITHAPADIYMAIGFTVVATPVLLWRIRLIRHIFANGIEVPGVITGISFMGGRGWVKYAYTYRGLHFGGYNAISQTGPARALRPGDQVTIVFRPDSPEQAEIRELYL
jgi:hypothetical protein